MTRTAIIGAGASGLSLALMLDGDVVIYEQADHPGGHCRATVRAGWTFDRGPHIMFSRDTEVLDFMIASLTGNVQRCRRNNRVSFGGMMAKYPLENDLASLDLDVRTRCLLDFLFNDHIDFAERPANLDEWFVGVFGDAMTDCYFRPYNEKLWNVALKELSMSWAERIPRPPAEDVVRGALGVSTEGYVHQLYYHYPRVGGYQAITDSWSKKLRAGVLRLSNGVEAITRVGEAVEVSAGGSSEIFDRVVCTVPMPHLLQLVGHVPERVRDAVARLRVNPTAVVTLGYRGVDRHQFTAVYFADSDFLPNRVSSPSVFSPSNAPPGCFSLQAEISYPPGESYLSLPDSDLTAHVHDGYVSAGLVDPDMTPIFEDVQRFKYAYVVYSHGYQSAVDTVAAWAKSVGVLLHGRFGAFDYLNVDGCVLRSRELASELNGHRTGLPRVG